ncbi:PKD domain-containing protein [Halolamina salifodinae]|uniref:PKD domain-containing protein n=1 Tax=Halolamina salifodinae TaxID=1202767 RepID=A0A8T4GXG1_9EURY|nr:PKD domain-containing protein [Halolamina salifodinae]MBP1986773.1 hypothetical protein [Halolamina salifodinae]
MAFLALSAVVVGGFGAVGNASAATTTYDAEEVTVSGTQAPSDGFRIIELEHSSSVSIESVKLTSSDGTTLNAPNYEDIFVNSIASDGSSTMIYNKSDATLGTVYSVGTSSASNGDTSTADTNIGFRGLQDSSGTKMATLQATWVVQFSDGSSLTVNYDSGSVTSTSVSTPNSAPSASTATGDRTVNAGESFTIDASSSSDPDGDSLTYEYKVGSGSYTSMDGSSTTLSFSDAGTNNITVRVTDAHGATDTTTVAVTVNAPPTISLAGTTSRSIQVGDTISIDASGTTDPEGDAVTYNYYRDTDSDSTLEQVASAAGATYTTASFDSSGTFDVRVDAVDSKGAVSSKTVTVTVGTTDSDGDGVVDSNDSYPSNAPETTTLNNSADQTAKEVAVEFENGSLTLQKVEGYNSTSGSWEVISDTSTTKTSSGSAVLVTQSVSDDYSGYRVTFETDATVTSTTVIYESSSGGGGSTTETPTDPLEIDQGWGTLGGVPFVYFFLPIVVVLALLAVAVAEE